MNDGGHMAVSPHDSNVVFCAGNVYPNSVWHIAVSHSSDAGTTWEHDTIPLGSNGLAVAFDPFDPNRVYVAGDSAWNYSYAQFLITTDLGATWTPSHSGLTGRVWTLVADPTQTGVLFCGTYQGVFKSTDAGASWAGTGFTRDTRALVMDPMNSRTIYAGTYSNGVHVTTDAGAVWNPMNDGLTCSKVLSLALRTGAENILFAGTEGGATFRTPVLTGIAGGSQVAGPRSPIAISPNPCRTATTVTLSSSLLPPPSSLSLYDASGRLVLSSPVRTSTFRLRTSSFSPGTYFVRLAAGALTRTARLTIAD